MRLTRQTVLVRIDPHNHHDFFYPSHQLVHASGRSARVVRNHALGKTMEASQAPNGVHHFFWFVWEGVVVELPVR